MRDNQPNATGSKNVQPCGLGEKQVNKPDGIYAANLRKHCEIILTLQLERATHGLGFRRAIPLEVVFLMLHSNAIQPPGNCCLIAGQESTSNLKASPESPRQMSTGNHNPE